MARDFNGSSQFLSLTDSILQGQRPMTFGCWLQTDSTAAGASYIFTNYQNAVNRGWSFRRDGANQAFTIHGVVDVVSSAAGVQHATGGWKWMGVSVSATNVKFVRIDPDGTIATEDVANSSAFTGSGQAVRVGVVLAPTGTGWWDGRIAELAIWLGDELTANEHLSAAFYGPLSVDHAPDLYLPLWGASDPEPDLSGSGFNATNGSTTLFDHAPVGRRFDRDLFATNGIPVVQAAQITVPTRIVGHGVW